MNNTFVTARVLMAGLVQNKKTLKTLETDCK